MSITAVASYFYMWYAKVPAPFGTRPVRKLLLLRATFGFLGVYGLYYSVQYLPLSEATVITFLAPILTCYACSLLIPGETFSRRQQLAALVSLAGVVLIARPFSKRDGAGTGTGDNAGTTAEDESPEDADAFHHVLATIVVFVGVLGAAGAYTTIRMIGRRAHPLVSVTYFSSVTTVISLVAMLTAPWVPFRLPSTAMEWTLLTGLGVCGFLLQFLLTTGLSYVPPASVRVPGAKASQGSKATNMVYMQMLFALFYDKVVWGSTLSPVSWAGSVLILACAIYVAVAQEERKEEKKPKAEVEEEENAEDEDDRRFKDRDDEETEGAAARERD
jgi:drug/metabolite transporter (DMT)-like permease